MTDVPENEQARVSVVIPAYNAEASIAEAVNSALRQTHRPIEVIVVDDGSQDSTAHVVESGFGPSVRLIRKANGGVSSARNTGMRAAGGDYVAFLDADDLWVSYKLEAQLSALSAFPESDLCYTDAELSNGRVRGLSYPVFVDHGWTYADIFARRKTLAAGGVTLDVHAGPLFRYLLYNGMILPSSVLIRTAFFKRHALVWVESIRTGFEDSLFFLDASRHTALTFIDAPLVKYRSPVDAEQRLSANRNNPARISGFIEGIKTIADESGFATESPEWVDHCLASSYRRLGYHYLSELQLRQARPPLRTSLKYEPRHMKTYLLLLSSFLPPWGVRALGALKRGLRRGRSSNGATRGATT